MSTHNEKRAKILRTAVDEANRFIARAKDAMKDLSSDDWNYPSKNIAAAKRASMDLTRALADVRRSPYQ